jgi:hypothetical protein
MVDISKLTSIDVDGIDTRDYPDFCDAYICYAEIDGEPLTEVELDQVNEDRDFVYDCVLDKLF